MRHSTKTSFPSGQYCSFKPRTEVASTPEQVLAELAEIEQEIKALTSHVNALKRDEDMIRTSLRSSNVVLCQYTTGGTIVESNPAFRRLYGPAVPAHFLDAISSEHPFAAFSDQRTVDGRPHTVHWVSAARYRRGRLAHAVIIGVEADPPENDVGQVDPLGDVNLLNCMNMFAKEGFWVGLVGPQYRRGILPLFVSRKIEEWWCLPSWTHYTGPSAWLGPIVPAHRGRAAESFLNFVQGRSDEIDVTVRVMCGGSDRWIRGRAMKVDGTGGGHALGTLEDVSAMIAAEEISQGLQLSYSMLERCSDTVVWLADVSRGSYRVLFVNKGWERFTGCPPTTFKAGAIEFCRGFLVPDEADWFVRRLRLFFQGQLPQFNIEHRFRNMVTGQLFHMTTKGTLVRDSAGRPSLAVIIGTDVTELVAARHRLRQTNRMFEHMSGTVADVFFIADFPPNVNEVMFGGDMPAWKPLRFISHATSDLFSMAPETIQYHPGLLQEYVAEQDFPVILATVLSFLHQCTTEPASARLEFMFAAHVAGGVKHILVRAKPTVSLRGAAAGLVGSFVDVSDLVETQQRLATSMRHFDLISDNMTTIYYLMDQMAGQPHFRVLYINKHYETLTGRTREALYRRGSDEWWDLVHPEDRDTARSMFARDSGLRRYRLLLDGGRVCHIQSQRVEVRHTNGMCRTAGFINDISEIIEAQQRKSDAQAQLYRAQKLESLGVLAAGVSHDFGNLTAVMMGDADMALEMLAPGDPVRVLLDSIVGAASRASRFTQELLAYSGKGQFAVVPINLTAMARAMADIIQASLPPNVTVNWKLSRESTLPAVKGDPSQLQQVLSNIVANAVEAIGTSPGSLTISTGHCGMHWVYMAVADTGCGMGEAVRQHVFDPFFSTKLPGARGLGMAAVKGIVDCHGGAIELRSALGEGTVLTVRFPAIVR
ncbi:Histidine kinase-, DNA gyrase B-, and HSP90-like ATPase [Carpediemonas membranifera]|uniref:Histidine kinase-, DNA gyrase B-, and HSP90-like ATPase n=1 Tax=Carpediemonas membranifera TaxID=201153 RepID=A0A8J6B5R2_9EUKA|nr:Histidine kinase-, DNA gyrase B-, and HSP90-like ATPase [Carpediemonas membranifera]|eukprot:KAG9390582.1 Histidine kinase-, DNA gyrase B-, and HSP90-like ATPase [Carpediemonas membranifera]